MPDGGPPVEADQAITLRGFERSLPMALMRAREAVMQGFRPHLAAHGLTEQQWRVLRALDAAPGSLAVGQLADATFLLGPSLSRMVASLGERGLLRRNVADHDGRRADLTITAAGRRLVATIAPDSEAWYTRIEAQLGPGDIDRLHELLDRLSELDAD